MKRTWIYQSEKSPDIGFSIQEETNEFTIWIDNYEGGEAYITDWDMLDEEEFKTFEEAYDWIVTNYGKIKEIN